MGSNFTKEDVNRSLNIKVNNEDCCSSFCVVTVNLNMLVGCMKIRRSHGHKEDLFELCKGICA